MSIPECPTFTTGCYADGELFDGRTRAAGDGDAVIPETRYEDPYAWNRMADFYPADELPEWLRFPPSSEECRRELELVAPDD